MKRLSLVILLVLVCNAAFSSDETQVPPDCEASMQIGREHARTEPWAKWFWTGFSLAAAVLVYDIAAEWAFEGYYDHIMFDVGGASLMLSIGALPLVLTPRTAIPVDNEIIDPECYRKGYVRTLRRRNLGASVGGSLAFYACLYVVGGVIVLVSWIYL